MQATELTETPAGLQPSPRICIVIVFLGAWPAWIRYFLQSCSRNSQFQWLIFGSAPPITPTPHNVQLVPIDQPALEQLVSEKLALPWKMARGYKLVDLKPAYGHIFSEWLQGYDFWGYTDMDVIYGQLSDFLTPAILETYDIITANEKVLVGHFTLLRNTQRFCHLYQQAENWLEVLCSEAPAGFDEKGFQVLVKRLASEGELSLYAENISREDIRLRLTRRPRFVMLWHSGRLYDLFAFSTTAYFHFMESKWSPDFSIASMPEVADAPFFVHRKGIVPLNTVSSFLRFGISCLIALVFSLPWYARQFLRKLVRRN
ncbi:MAG: DUF6625 family protein [Planctomycetia bacterium]